MKPLTQEWVEKAEGDFQVAAQIMRRRKQRVYDAACFHAQQTVEKYFKARLCGVISIPNASICVI
jgi:HEPN domain-containing protein